MFRELSDFWTGDGRKFPKAKVACKKLLCFKVDGYERKFRNCEGMWAAKVEEKKRKVEVGSRLDEYICNCAKSENL